MTNDLANRFLIPVLTSKTGTRLGRQLALVEYVGRRSGHRHQLVTQYVTDGRTVHINVGRPEAKTWWRNFQAPHHVRLRLAGVDFGASAEVVLHGDRVTLVAELDLPDGSPDA